MGIDVRLINKRGEQKIKGWALYPDGRMWRGYWHCRGVSRIKVFASKYYLQGTKPSLRLCRKPEEM